MFDNAFLTNEISQAENIKDKLNRKCVIRVLKMLKSRLGGIETTTSESGVLIFAGVLIDGSEMFEIVSPPNCITEFYYECNKHFNTHRFINLFEESVVGNVVLIDGHQTLIYEYGGTFKLRKQITANLIKRQGRGGSSSGRFMRLAEESRHHYIVHVADYVNSICQSDNVWLFGGNELKTDLMQYSQLKIKFKTNDIYHQFTRDTIKDPYFKTLMVGIDTERLKKIEQVVYLLDTNPDMLIFSLTEITDNVEYLINVSDLPLVTSIDVIKLKFSDKYYSRLKDFDLIGKLYYVEQ